MKTLYNQLAFHGSAIEEAVLKTNYLKKQWLMIATSFIIFFHHVMKLFIWLLDPIIDLTLHFKLTVLKIV
jgi:preprotein translocase subunit SecE